MTTDKVREMLRQEMHVEKNVTTKALFKGMVPFGAVSSSSVLFSLFVMNSLCIQPFQSLISNHCFILYK